MTNDKTIKKLIKALEDVINQFQYVTYVDMNDDPSVVKARKLIEELRVKS